MFFYCSQFSHCVIRQEKRKLCEMHLRWQTKREKKNTSGQTPCQTIAMEIKTCYFRTKLNIHFVAKHINRQRGNERTNEQKNLLINLMYLLDIFWWILFFSTKFRN